MKYYATFIVLAALTGGLVFVWGLGWYPVASVNGEFIYAREVQRTAQYMKSFSSEIARVTNEQREEPVDRLSDAEIRDFALEEAIEQRIIHGALLENTSSKVLAELVEEELDALRKDRQFQDTFASLFEEDFSAIEQYILAPQAERDILTSRLFLEGEEDFQAWLKVQKEETAINRF